jgi:hypothetical protein
MVQIVGKGKLQEMQKIVSLTLNWNDQQIMLVNYKEMYVHF